MCTVAIFVIEFVSFIGFIFTFPDPSHVIGLFPNLLPQDYRNQLEYPDRLPELEGGELEKGLLALVEFLLQVGFIDCHSMTSHVNT